MASLLSGTTIGGHVAVHANNISTYALTSVPSNVITTSGGQTIGGTTYFSGGESLNLYGIRGRFTNEYIHLYNKVGIGHPSGWGQGEGNTPTQGLSTYGGMNIAYGNGASSTINGYLRINQNWTGGDYGAEQFTIRGEYPSIVLRNTAQNQKWLIHNSSYVRFYYGDEVDNNSWEQKFHIATDGNIWMSWADEYISTLLDRKQNASTAINTSNIGSQSVSYASSAGNADTVDGYHASAFTQVPTWTSNTQSASRSNFVSTGNWYRIANLGTERFFARVRIYDDSSSGPHASVEFQVAGAFNDSGGYSFNLTSNGYYNAPSVTQVRILSKSTYDPQYLEVYIAYVGYVPATFVVSLLEARNASVVNWDAGSIPSGYSATTWDANAPLAVGGRSAIFNSGIYSTSDYSRLGNVLVGQGTYKNTIKPIDDANLNIQTPSGAVYFDTYGQASGSFRAPIFYDSDDTGFYLDPNGTSNLNKFSDRTMGFNGMNPMSASSPYASRYNASVNYRTGSMGYGAVDLNAIGSNWGSGFIDSWSWPGQRPNDSTSHWVGLQGIHYGHQDSSNFYGFQMVSGADTNRFYLRASWPTPLAWREIITSGNIASQSVSYADESGYSASSGSVEWGNVNSRPTALSQFTNDSGYVTSSGSVNYATSAGNSDTVDGLHASAFTRDYGQQVNVGSLNDLDGRYLVNLDGYGPINTAGGPDGSYNAGLIGIGNASRGHQIYMPYDQNQMYFRRGAGGWSDWIRVLNATADPYAAGMNQNVRTDSDPTFANVYTNGWFRNYGNAGIYNQTYGTHFYSNGGGNWVITGSGGNVELQFRSNHQSTLRGWVYANTSNEIGFLSEDGNWVLRTWNRGVEAYGSMRAPIFYDSNDTYYYVDPNSTSRLVSTRIIGGEIRFQNGGYYNNLEYWGTRMFSQDDGNGVPLYVQVQWVDGWRNALKIASGVNDDNPSLRTYYTTQLATDSGNVSIGGTASSHKLHVYGTAYATSDFRAPIFYDSNDTTYYLDPNSTGKSLNVAGNIDLIARSASWAEGIRVRVPSTSTWGGIRFTRDRAGDDGNWAIGFTGIDATDDLTFWGNTGGEGAMRMRLDQAANLITYGSMRAPIFYDSENTGYYVDPASRSNLNMLTLSGAGHFFPNSWIEFSGYYGLYSAYNGAHFYPNNATYGSWRVAGSRNGYNGLEFDSSNGQVTLMIRTNSNITGFHNNSYGWQFYWEGGTLYCYKSSYGGGTSAVVLDSSNWSSYISVPAGLVTGNTSSAEINTSKFNIYNSNFTEENVHLQMNARTVVEYNRMWNTSYFYGGPEMGIRMAISEAGFFFETVDYVPMPIFCEYVEQLSDVNLKHYISTIQNPIEKVKQLRGVNFLWKKNNQASIGFIAQEVEEVLPVAVGNANGNKTIDYSKIIPVLTEAIKEQQTIIEQLMARLDALESK